MAYVQLPHPREYLWRLAVVCCGSGGGGVGLLVLLLLLLRPRCRAGGASAASAAAAMRALLALGCDRGVLYLREMSAVAFVEAAAARGRAPVRGRRGAF